MILVTGATGAAGSHVVAALTKLGTPCRVIVRDPAKAVNLGPKVEAVKGDLADAASLDAAMKGIDQLMLIAPPTENGAQLELAAIAAAKRNGISHVVDFSSAGAHPKSTGRFMRAHGTAEKELEWSGIPWTILRPTFFMQNLLGLAGMIKSGTIYMDTADSKAPFIDLVDVGEVAAKVLTSSGHEGKIYELTGPMALSYGDIAAIFSKALGKPVKFVNIPPAALLDSLKKSGVPAWNAEGILELNEAMSKGYFAKVSDASQKITGHSPRTLEQFIADNRPAFA